MKKLVSKILVGALLFGAICAGGAAIKNNKAIAADETATEATAANENTDSTEASTEESKDDSTEESSTLVKPAKPKFKVVSKRKGTAYITWSKAKDATAVEIYYKKAGDKYTKIKNTKNKSSNRKLLTNLEEGKKYYFRMRTYRKVDGKKVYSKTTTKRIKISSRVVNFVEGLEAAQNETQIIVVSASGTSATVSLHNRNANGTWTKVLSTSGYVGYNGIGKTKEGDGKTPVGTFHFLSAFGLKDDPGTRFEYTKTDDTYHFVDDSNSKYYNTMVKADDVTKDWNSSEHITSVGAAYNYSLIIDYNKKCTKGLGSGIFLHCSKGNPTAGCVSVPEADMITILKKVKKDCLIIIDSSDNISKY